MRAEQRSKEYIYKIVPLTNNPLSPSIRKARSCSTNAHAIQRPIGNYKFFQKNLAENPWEWDFESWGGEGGERSPRSENRWRVQKGERRRWGDDEGEVIMMQKSQFSGRLGAMRRDTPRCCAIIITTGVIIPSPDLQRGWREVRNGFQPIAAGCLWCTFNGYSWPPRKMDGPRIVVIPISSPPRSILRETVSLLSAYIYFISFILLFVTFPFFIHNFAKHSYRHILLIICLTSLLIVLSRSLVLSISIFLLVYCKN